MASIYAVLPAEDAIALDLALDGSARAAKATGDARTIDQLRADVLAAAGADALARGGFGVPPDLWAKLTAAMDCAGRRPRTSGSGCHSPAAAHRRPRPLVGRPPRPAARPTPRAPPKAALPAPAGGLATATRRTRTPTS